MLKKSSYNITNAKSNYNMYSVFENKSNPNFFKDLDASKTCISKVTSIGLMINNKIRFDKLKAATHFNTFFQSLLGR